MVAEMESEPGIGLLRYEIEDWLEVWAWFEMGPRCRSGFEEHDATLNDKYWLTLGIYLV